MHGEQTENFSPQEKERFEGNTWTVASRLSEVGPTLEALEARLKQLNWDDESIHWFSLAFDEILANAVIHAGYDIQRGPEESDESYQNRIFAAEAGPDVEMPIEVILELTEDEAKVTVRDRGKGFDPAKIKDPTRDENLLTGSGRGKFIIEAMKDRGIEKETIPSPQGTRASIFMKKKIGSTRI